MSTFNFAPLYRSTIGFDRLFDLLDNSTPPDWPPYNIEKKGENEYRISMALAGFRPDEIELTQHGGNLIVAGQRKVEENGPNILHQGIASRSFKPRRIEISTERLSNQDNRPKQIEHESEPRKVA